MKITEMVEEYFSKPFVFFLVLSLVVILTSLVVGSFRGYEISLEEANQILDQLEIIRENITLVDLFINNFVMVSLISFIPLAGIVWMGFIQYNTGYIVGALSKALNVDPLLYLSSLLTSPVGFIEYIAYIFVLGEGFVIVYSLYDSGVKEGLFKRLKEHTWKTLIIVCLLLFVGAVIEAWLLGRL